MSHGGDTGFQTQWVLAQGMEFGAKSYHCLVGKEFAFLVLSHIASRFDKFNDFVASRIPGGVLFASRDFAVSHAVRR